MLFPFQSFIVGEQSAFREGQIIYDKVLAEWKNGRQGDEQRSKFREAAEQFEHALKASPEMVDVH